MMSDAPTPVTSRRTAPIDARLCWNVTDLMLEAGHSYDFSATGTWRDANIVCDAGGYPPPTLSALQAVILKPFESLRRVPAWPWFSLVGAIDQDMRTAFLIGRGGRVTAPKTGMLTCFANDVPFMYWNNSGIVTLTVTPS